jgi:hypothetical protein
MIHPENLPAFFLEKPERISAVGHGLMFTATVMLILAVCGRALLLAASLKFFTQEKLIPTTLSELNLPWPTWFVAESIFGYLFIVIVAAAGMYLAYYGKHLRRFADSF